VYEKKLKILREILGNSRQVGAEHLFRCPFCKHHKPKMSINLDRGAKCWICNWSSVKVSKLVSALGNFEQKRVWSTFEQTVEINDFSSQLFGPPDTAAEKQSIFLPRGYKPLFNKKKDHYSRFPLNYLKGRGIFRTDILYWKIGYCTDGDYKDRIIIPSFDLDGDVNYFIARSFGDDWMKYKNPPTQKDIVFNELMIDWEKPITLVEGVFDAITAGKNSIPLLGSTLRESSKLFQAIIDNNPVIYIALDADAENKAYKIISSLLQYNIKVYKVTLEFGDAGDLSRERFDIFRQKASLIDESNYLLHKTRLLEI
tara:strand:- start:1639 stop:2577 length:939 start_codon:yes stop_codon:yes gene_type:complete